MHAAAVLTPRAADPADRTAIDALRALYCAKFSVPPDDSVAKLWRVVGSRDVIAGCYAYSLTPEYLVIHDFYVVPGVPGQRAAAAMWAELHALAGQGRTLVGSVVPGNEAQRRAMERHGWKPVAIIYTYVEGGE